jgi:hypothetical protein
MMYTPRQEDTGKGVLLSLFATSHRSFHLFIGKIKSTND